MAARKSGSDYHNAGPCSYLDDVPFKINDKFKSPAKVGFPVGFCIPDCAHLLAGTGYDFTLERQTVRWGKELEQAQAEQLSAELEAQAARVKSEGEEPRPAPQGRDGRPRNGKPFLSAGDTDPAPPAMNPVLAGLRHNAILTPLPAPSLGPARRPSPPPAAQSLNLADFEREEDPFDKLELKTLDDKEELRSILQGQVVAPAEPEPEPRTEPVPAKSGRLHIPNGLVALSELDGSAGAPIGSLQANRPCNIRSLTFPKLSNPGDLSKQPGVCALTALRHLSNGPTPSTLFQNNIGPQESHSQTCNGTQKPPLPVAAPSTPRVAAVGVGAPLGAGPGWQGAPLGAGPGWQGAPLGLSSSQQQCVETIVSMGYSHGDVLKAMQRQGQNLEQVLDYLLVHGRLCERGFDASAVEECLEMSQCSEEKALKFLRLVSQFREMGFERDSIKEALLVHNSDQNKALEDLMARAATS